MADYAALHEPYAPLLRAALAAATPPAARVALDLGAGAGAKTPWLAECAAPGALVLAADLDLAALKGGAWPARLGADAHALPLRDTSFDLVWCVAALAVFAAPEVALAEIRRVLRPGGVLVVAAAGERWVRLRRRPTPAASGPLPRPADGLGEELLGRLEAAGLVAPALAAYLLDPPGLAPLAAALPLADLDDGAEPEEPEPLPVLLVASAFAPWP
jgi:SAM-dependent methyltransferase